MEIYTDVKGRTGIDCGGFCEFCFYKNVNFSNLNPTGCINCPPHQKGCLYCLDFVERVYTEFIPIYQVLADINKKLKILKPNEIKPKDIKVIVAGAADILNYPKLYELVSILKESLFNIHLGYTSGKPIKNEVMVENLISLGVDEVSFSVFSTNPELRRKWMKDNSPVDSIKGLKLFCENIDLHASAVVIPGINDKDQIFETCANLEEWGAKTLILRRFANYQNQGLIFNKKPIIEGITPHSYEKFQEFVQKVSDEFSLEVFGYPFFDPKNESPFCLAKPDNKVYLQNLPEVRSEVTLITGELAAPFLKKILNSVDESNLVNVVVVNKEIADLITIEDLEFIDLTEVKSKVIIPRGALVHDREAEKILCKDGKQRKIKRGPLVLTYPGIGGDKHLTNKIKLIEYELKSLKELIEIINTI